MTPSPLYIDGAWRSGDGATVPVVNPATLETVGAISESTPAEIDAALQAAARAFPAWAKTPPARRAEALRRVANLLDERAEKIARVMTAEQGKPVNEALGEMRKLAAIFTFYAEEATRIPGEIIANDSDAYQSLVVREPAGVVAAISPWNYPAELIGWKAAAGLAAGCAVVVKPPELTPLTPLEIARCIHDAGLPAGVLNMVTGAGAEVGQTLVESALVAKIAFTGSAETGLKIQRACRDIKRLSLELGGNCPMLVTENADLDSAVRGAARRSFRNMGQICIAVNRIYVAAPVYAEFVEKLAAAADALVVDNGLDNPAADLGPMAAAEPLAKTRAHLADALERGARLVAGGERPPGAKFAKGYFFRPTVVADCAPSMRVMREETFGPLVGVAPYQTLQQAVNLANDSPYGLAAYAYTKHLDEMRFVSRRLDYGSVAINHVDAGIINAPYGGRKQSGVGYEHGREGLLEYLNIKHIRLCFDEPGVCGA